MGVADRQPNRGRWSEALLPQLLIASEPLVVARPGHAVVPAGKGHVSGDLLRMADDGKAPSRVPRDFSFRQLVSSLHFAGDLENSVSFRARETGQASGARDLNPGPHGPEPQ